MEIRNGKLIISNAGGTASSGAKTDGLNFALTEKKL